jgi:hypothetical protein
MPEAQLVELWKQTSAILLQTHFGQPLARMLA